MDIGDSGTWNEKILANPDGGEILQSEEFLSFKGKFGWEKRLVKIDLGGEDLAVGFLVKKVPLLGELWYAPRGPGVVDLAGLDIFLSRVRDLAPHAFMIKVEPKILGKYLNEHKLNQLREKYQLRSVKPVQANWNTVVVDLTPDKDHILAGFRQRARRSIRQAEASGFSFEVSNNTDADFEDMYRLYAETGARAGFKVRDKNYYFDFWRRFVGANMGQLFFVLNSEGKRVSGAFILMLGGEGLYKDGASEREAGSRGAGHLLQWGAMKWLKNRGVKRYDLHGCPPESDLDNPSHPLYSLGMFKTSFSSDVVSTVGCLDIILKPRAYKLWQKRAQKLMQTYEWRVRSRTLY